VSSLLSLALAPPAFGPRGETVFERTYFRTKPNGSKENWAEAADRVTIGNLALVYGPPDTWSDEVWDEARELFVLIYTFGALPAGRHLKSTGVKGRQYLFNCHVSPWGDKQSRQHGFQMARLFEMGGVGANYSNRYLEGYRPQRELKVHIVCSPDHPDYYKMRNAGLLSTEFSHEWTGAYPVEDTREGWVDAQTDLIDTYYLDTVLHADRVYDVSRVREEGAPLRTTQGTASGPLPLAQHLLTIGEVMNKAAASGGHVTSLQAMLIDHGTGKAVVAGGTRRSARMSMKSWKDHDIMAFINCKADSGDHWTTNISVEIDNHFIVALSDTTNVMHDHALAVYRAAVTGMLQNGEPGFWNRDLSQEGEVNEIVATNPCGEIPLPGGGACVLGHVNLQHFAPKTKGGLPDIEGMVRAHQLMTRFLIRATYGDMNDPEQAAVMQSERRIGVGHFGMQGMLAKMGIRYSEAPAAPGIRTLFRTLRRAVRQEARDYAFALRIPEPVKVTTEAPTGTVAKGPGTSEGAQAIYARTFIGRTRFSIKNESEFEQVSALMAKGHKAEPDVYDSHGNTWVVEFPTKDPLVAEVEAMGYPAEIVESQDELTLQQSLEMQAMLQECYADNGISFTVNVPAEPHQQAAMDAGAMVPPPSEERVAEVMETLLPYLPRLKGTTMMIDGSRPQAPYERMTVEEYEAAVTKSVEVGYDENCASGACPV
jgi:adenosylcobalamin-dependent ribonucleoside-triphosphate reductase